MVIIENINDTTFRLNGTKYVKNFIVIKQGNTNVAIYNYYDTRFQLLSPTKYNQIQVDGVVYPNQTDLINILAPILYAKVSGGGGGAPLNNPAFTGIPTAPTAIESTNTTQIATTAFVHSIVPKVTISTVPPVGVPADGEEWVTYTS